jgi:hypothetical protein
MLAKYPGFHPYYISTSGSWFNLVECFSRELTATLGLIRIFMRNIITEYAIKDYLDRHSQDKELDYSDTVFTGDLVHDLDNADRLGLNSRSRPGKRTEVGL